MHYVKKTLHRYEQSATKHKSVVATHISPQDSQATFITIFRIVVSISDSQSCARNGSDLFD